MERRNSISSSTLWLTVPARVGIVFIIAVGPGIEVNITCVVNPC